VAVDVGVAVSVGNAVCVGISVFVDIKGGVAEGIATVMLFGS
jgi:hypothetical protein